MQTNIVFAAILAVLINPAAAKSEADKLCLMDAHRTQLELTPGLTAAAQSRGRDAPLVTLDGVVQWISDGRTTADPSKTRIFAERVGEHSWHLSVMPLFCRSSMRSQRQSMAQSLARTLAHGTSKDEVDGLTSQILVGAGFRGELLDELDAAPVNRGATRAVRGEDGRIRLVK